MPALQRRDLQYTNRVCDMFHLFCSPCVLEVIITDESKASVVIISGIVVIVTLNFNNYMVESQLSSTSLSV